MSDRATSAFWRSCASGRRWPARRSSCTMGVFTGGLWAVLRRRAALSSPGRSAQAEALALQAADVVGEADEEEHEHEREADDPGALHHRERHGAAADLLDERPKDVAPVEGEEGKQVDERER